MYRVSDHIPYFVAESFFFFVIIEKFSKLLYRNRVICIALAGLNLAQKDIRVQISLCPTVSQIFFSNSSTVMFKQHCSEIVKIQETIIVQSLSHWSGNQYPKNVK